MYHTDGFVDLRVHRALDASHSDESVWPSFTDIMMVVVMIFLISSVVFMLRNVELNRGIESARTTEQEAIEAREALQQKTAYLNEIIEETKSRLAVAEFRRDELRNLSIQRATRIQELEYETLGLYETQALLSGEVDQLNQLLDEMRTERAALTGRMESMIATAADLEQLIDDKNSELAGLEKDFEAKLQEIADVEQQLQRAVAQYTSLQHDYIQLQTVGEEQQTKIADLESKQAQSELQVLQLESESETLAEQLDASAVNVTVEQTKKEQLSALNEEQRLEIQRLLQSERELSVQLEKSELLASILEQEKNERIEEIDQLQKQLAAQEQQLLEISVESGEQVAQLTTTQQQQRITINDLARQAAQLRKELSARLDQIFGMKDKQLKDAQLVHELSTKYDNLRSSLAEARRTEAEQRTVMNEQSEELTGLKELNQQLAREIQQKNQQIAEITDVNVQVRQNIVETKAELDELRQAYQLRIAELSEIQSLFEARNEQTKNLESQIVRLEDENQIMLRPARSMENRYVVNISYDIDENGNKLIQYKLPGQENAVQLSYERLEEVLSDLKSERKEGIYTKIYFPNEEKISFAEAWRFTNDIQDKYDYYHSQSVDAQ